MLPGILRCQLLLFANKIMQLFARNFRQRIKSKPMRIQHRLHLFQWQGQAR